MQIEKLHDVVRWVINEDDGGDWGGGSDGGFGEGDSGGASLYSTFIRPFVDVYETSKYVVETGMSKIQLLSGIATYSIMTMFMPFVKANFQSMIEHDKRRMRNIYQKYSDVFKRTEQALTETGGNYDGAGVFFVLFPDMVIARNLSQNVATMGKDSAKIAADTAFDFLDAVTLNATSGITDPLRKRLGFMESRDYLIEDANESNVLSTITKLYQHPKIKSALANSSMMKGMKRDGLEALKDMIAETIEPINKLQEVKDVASLERATGKKLDIKSAMRDKKVDPSTIKKEELDIAVADAVPSLVKQAAKPFVERLSGLKRDMQAQAEKYGVVNTREFKIIMKLFDDGLGELKDS